jgi:tetratricopeptide (TPR) repeat protein
MSPPDNEAVHSKWNQPSKHQMTAAFVVGILVLVVLLASALFGVVPHQYAGDIFKLCIAVAGAGFTLFLIGQFEYKSKGLSIGGSLGVFVALMFWNPAERVRELLHEYLNKNFRACRENVQSRQFDVAEADCAKAAYEFPESGSAMHWLALCQYHQERYRDAITSWKRAARLGYEPARTHYNIAFANFQLRKFEDAAKEARLAVDASSGNAALKARAWFMVADAELSLWDFGAGSDQHFVNAVDAFQAFLEIGTPKFKAQAELACILAVKGQLTQVAADKDHYEAEAEAAFSSAVSELNGYEKSDAKMQRSSFADVYEPSSGPCGTVLDELWKKRRPDESYKGLLIKVRG